MLLMHLALLSGAANVFHHCTFSLTWALGKQSYEAKYFDGKCVFQIQPFYVVSAGLRLG